MADINIAAVYTAHAALEIAGTLPDETAYTITLRDLNNIPDRQAIEASVKRTGGTYAPICFPVFFEASGDAAVPTTTAGSGDLTYQAMFLCCVEKPRFVMAKEKREGENKTILSFLGENVVNVMTAYLNELFDNDDLDNTLAADLTVTVEPGVFPWDGEDFAGFIVRQTWTFMKD